MIISLYPPLRIWTRGIIFPGPMEGAEDWLGEAHAMPGRAAEARNCLAEAARIVETSDERLNEAELLHRVPGDLLNAAGDRYGADSSPNRCLTRSQSARPSDCSKNGSSERGRMPTASAMAG